MISEIPYALFAWVIFLSSAAFWAGIQYDRSNENRLAVQIAELDEALEDYGTAHYATLRQCAGVVDLVDGGVTREIDIPIWSIPALHASVSTGQRNKNKIIPPFLSSNSTYHNLGAAVPSTSAAVRHHDCQNKIDHNRDGDTDDIGENYPISLEEAGLLPLWLSVGGENPDRYGSSLGIGILGNRGNALGDSDKRLQALQAEARGRFGLIVRPIFRFVDGDPIVGSYIPAIQILAGIIQIPELDEDSYITSQAGLAASAVKSGSSGVGILSRDQGNLVIGIGDSWRLGIADTPTVWNSELLCFRMVAPRPSTTDIQNQNYCKTDGSVNSNFRSHEITNFYPHAAGRGDEFTAASLVLLHTISDNKYEDTSLSRVDTGIPGLNRMQTGIDMAGFGFNNVAYIIAPDADNNGEPDDALVIIGPKSDRRAVGTRTPPITLVGDFHVTGELTVGDGLRVADLGGRPGGDLVYRTDVSGRRFVSLDDQLYLDPEPVSYAQLDAAVPRITDVPTGVDENNPVYGQGWLPMSGLPGVQIVSGVHLGGELTGVGGARIAGPRIGLVAESAYAGPPPVPDPASSDPPEPHGLGQNWTEFNEQGHSPDQIIAGNFEDSADAAYRPGAFDNDPANPLQRLKSVDHYRDPTGKFGFVNGQLRFIGRNGAVLAGSGQNGVSIWATDGDARMVAGQNVRSDPDDNTHLPDGPTSVDGPLVAQTHTQSGNVILHNSDSTQASGGILLDPDQVILINDDVAAVETRGRGRNPEAIYALADNEANPDTRPNLQYVEDGDDVGVDAREILPGIGLYDETRYALNDPVGTGAPQASRFEGRPLASAFPRLVLNQIEFADSNQPSGISAVGGSSTVTFQHSRNGITDPAIVALDNTRTRTGATQIPVLDPVTGRYDGETPETCPGGGFAEYQVVPTSWRQPDYVEVRNTQTLAFNLGVGGTVDTPEYAGTSAVNLEFTTVLPYLGWSIDPVTGEDSSTYGDSAGTNRDIPDDGTAETRFSVIWYCRY